MLIVIEGLDGSGKSTQVRKVREYICERGLSLRYIHFPRYDAPVVGEMISAFLSGDYGNNEKVDPQIVALLYAEDRRDAAPQIREWLSQGDVVLLDRYVYSNIAFQCAKVADPVARERLRSWIFESEYGKFLIPQPELNIFLDVPLSFVGSKLSAQRSGADRDYLQGKDDIHEADMDFQRRVRDAYLDQCGKDSRFVRIDCSDEEGGMLPEDVIFEKIAALINGYLG